MSSKPPFKDDVDADGARYIGVDVGTSGVRSALIGPDGCVLATADKTLRVNNPAQDFYQQSSEEIWSAVEECVARVVSEGGEGGGGGAGIRGIGFDATCSLVAVGADGKGISIDSSGAPEWDVVLWMDHRAKKETKEINVKAHPVLQFVGGRISPEMQTPKLLWLRRNLPEERWKKIEHFFDLSDFLTWKASGSLSRSLCATVCKWTYEVEAAGPGDDDDGDGDGDGDGTDRGRIKGWNEQFFRQAGLGELADEGFRRLGGENVLSPGSPCGYLLPGIRSNFQISASNPPIAVGTSLIDAHAGALGLLASSASLATPIPQQLGLICGTSSCHMALSRRALKVPGVWGPYYSAVLPGLWLLEGGQTVVGKLIDHVMQTHPSYARAEAEAGARAVSVFAYLEQRIETLREEASVSDAAILTRNVHVYPDFHGNRAPLADPSMRGMVCGLTLDAGMDDLATMYLATVQAVAYSTRHIVDEMRSQGQEISVVTICGGLSQSDVFVQTHADVLGLSVVRPDGADSVLLGAAMLGAAAAGAGSLESIARQMSREGRVFKPNEPLREFHGRKYKVFRKMCRDQLDYRKMMME